MSTGRSPGYPFFDLETAVQKLRTLYTTYKRSQMSVLGALELLGYTSLNGPSRRVIAALVAYGLLDDEGEGESRQVRVNENGRKILILEQDDPERVTLIQSAAIRPKPYSELADKCKDQMLPDSELRRWLISKNYNEDIIPKIIKDFKSTLEFAGLSNDGIMSDEEEREKLRAEEEQRKRDHESFQTTFNQIFNSSGKKHQEVNLNPVLPADPLRTPPPPPPPSEGWLSHTLAMKDGRRAILHVPPDISRDDEDLMKRSFGVIMDSLPVPVQETRISELQPPVYSLGPAFWHTTGVDVPITISGYKGIMDGRHYVAIEGSNSGVPLDQVIFPSREEEQS